jgi:hypothetical protein
MNGLTCGPTGYGELCCNNCCAAWRNVRISAPRCGSVAADRICSRKSSAPIGPSTRLAEMRPRGPVRRAALTLRGQRAPESRVHWKRGNGWSVVDSRLHQPSSLRAETLAEPSRDCFFTAGVPRRTLFRVCSRYKACVRGPTAKPPRPSSYNPAATCVAMSATPACKAAMLRNDESAPTHTKSRPLAKTMKATPGVLSPSAVSPTPTAENG